MAAERGQQKQHRLWLVNFAHKRVPFGKGESNHDDTARLAAAEIRDPSRGTLPSFVEDSWWALRLGRLNRLAQYALANTARALVGWPVNTHLPGTCSSKPGSSSNGTQRIVTLCLARISAVSGPSTK